ncbi:nucleoside 2-deoxyribosyltransferase [Patescibacteria group bacterium]|nr:nucleoside 2-deoxyribosyltransferase [Patescibacteria group bacterium]
MKIYFAASIRGGRKNKNLHPKIINLLSKFGLVLTEHIGDKNLTDVGENISDKQIYKRDLSWLKKSDVIVAEVTTPSLGVGYEIAIAKTLDKKILCIYNSSKTKRLSAMIKGDDALVVKEYQTINDLKAIFEDFFIK